MLTVRLRNVLTNYSVLQKHDVSLLESFDYFGVSFYRDNLSTVQQSNTTRRPLYDTTHLQTVEELRINVPFSCFGHFVFCTHQDSCSSSHRAKAFPRRKVSHRMKQVMCQLISQQQFVVHCYAVYKQVDLLVQTIRHDS